VIPGTLLLLSALSGDCEVGFTDVAASARTVFRHERGATADHRLPETMGSGLAWLDYDGDGWMDLYVVQSGPFPPAPAGSPAAQDRLFRNRGDGTFEDMTAKSGLKDSSYGMGAFAADYDNDGDPDLYVTNWGSNTLYRNDGNGTFTDVTARAGVAASAWSTAAAWGDVDGDGWLDLFVVRYVDDSKEKDLFCGDTVSGRRRYCTPIVYPGTVNVLFRNRGDGTFQDVTASAGLGRAVGKGLGAVFFDMEPDGKADLYVANDLVVNFLFRNAGGRFEDISIESGAGFDPKGNPRGGMGVDAGDLDGDGLPDLVVANYENEANAHFRNLGSGIFEEVSIPSGFGVRHWSLVGFGLNLIDAEGDGDLDAFIANGHVFEEPGRQGGSYAQKPLLLWNDGSGKFQAKPCGPAFDTALVGRGSAAADYDNDGDPDLAVSNSGGPLQLLRNDSHGGRPGHWLGVELRGRKSNRQGIGARLTAELPSGRKLVRTVQAGSSYLSSSDPRVLFGLGEETSVKKLTIQWPSGTQQVVANPPADRYVKIEEK
jgi:hypothetical protein